MELIDSKDDVLLVEKLKESELRYRRLFESAKDGILILDFETGNIVDANPFIVKMIDFPLAEILGKKLWEIGLFSNKEQSEEAVVELKTNGYIRFEDMPIPQRDGKITEVEFVSNVYLVNNIKVIQCNIRDITERRHLEKKQEIIAKILTILGSQNNGMQLITEILTEIKSFTKVEAVAIRLIENDDYPYFVSIGFPEDFIKKENQLISQTEKGGIIYDNAGCPCLECMCGAVITGKTDSSQPFFTPGGSFYSNNTTELIASFLEKESIIVTRNNCNNAGYKSVALIPLYSGKEIIGLLQLNDKLPQRFTIEMIEFFEKIGKTIGIAFNRMQNESKIRESKKILRDQNVEYANLNKEYAVLNEELSESLNRIQNINEELKSAKEKAEESDKLKSAFLANMSHEIRTPMNAILGFSGFLLQPGLPKEKLDNFVQIINASSQQLMSIISDIIDISKIESGQITIETELVDINVLLSELFVTYKKLVELKKLSLVYNGEWPNELIQIISDGNRIKQVLCNLLNNAIKFTKEGSIEFGYKISDNFIEFYVKDTGIGISRENHALIFNRFRQVETSNSRLYGGNGLGLSISKALVEKLGGNLAINSDLGKGSTFSFTIPYIKSKIVEDSKVAPIKTFQPNWKNKTILLVEDEANNHAFTEEMLMVTKVNLVHAWDGKEATEQIIKHPEISLVLMDIKMPVMDGYEALKFIKQLRPNLPVIAQTAFALSHDRKKALDAGFDDYLAKPIDRELFMDMMDNYLSKVIVS